MPETDPTTHETDPEILYGRWLVASRQLRSAYAWWSEDKAISHGDRYAVVVAMLDQEAAAAAAYADAVRAASIPARSGQTAGEPAAPGAHSAAVGAGTLLAPDAAIHRAG